MTACLNRLQKEATFGTKHRFRPMFFPVLIFGFCRHVGIPCFFLISAMNKRKFEGAYKYKCNFKKNWITEEPFFVVLRENKKNPHSCHCTICDKDVDCSHQGKANIKRDVNGNTYVSKSEALLRRATKASNQ